MRTPNSRTGDDEVSPPQIVVFDLDDTLAPSKSPLPDSVRDALSRLLDHVAVCVISGGRFEQFDQQLLQGLSASDTHLERLHLMPTCGTRYYLWSGAWHLQYAHDLTESEKSRAIAALESGARELGLWSSETWGPIIEDRGSQITFSALGQAAPVAAKMEWDPDGSKKEGLRAFAQSRLADLEVRSGGSTSIDVTRKGIDKAYGVAKLAEMLNLELRDMVFVGDRLDEGGNDYPVKAMGVECIAVEGWEETVIVIDRLLARFWPDLGK
ncbi:MAG: HAD-IIB family hydrolase [Actinomycetota bacterium]